MVLNGNKQTTLYIISKYHGFYIGTDYIISKNHGFKLEHTRLYLNNHVLDIINIRTNYVRITSSKIFIVYLFSKKVNINNDWGFYLRI